MQCRSAKITTVIILSELYKKLTMKFLKGGKHPQTIAEEQSKKIADKNANDPKKIDEAIKKLKELFKKI